MYVVYSIRCLENDMVFYGLTGNWEQAQRTHVYNLERGDVNKENLLLVADWRKYGAGCFEWEIIWEGDNKDEASGVLWFSLVEVLETEDPDMVDRVCKIDGVYNYKLPKFKKLSKKTQKMVREMLGFPDVEGE